MFALRKRAAIFAGLLIVALGLLLGEPSIVHAAGQDIETTYIFNTFAFLIWGALVMWMCAGFTMLEAGSVRTKNASMICLKNIGLYSIAGLAYYFIGYNLMYVDVGDVIGSFKFLYGPTSDEVALAAGDGLFTEAMGKQGYSSMAGWFFQMVFVATAASIVSGTLAERVKMWSFFLFVLVLTAFIYPVIGAWTWGGGWLTEMGFKDFAGSTIVHGTGGLGGPGRRSGHWAEVGQVQEGRHHQGHAALERPGRDPRCVHTLVRLVRIQRRFSVGLGQRGRRAGDEPYPGKHQPGGGGGSHGRLRCVEAAFR